MDRWDVFATKDWVYATLLLVNAWQYAPPVDPVGSDGGISDPLRFVPPAAAEEVYLVTELGNVFPVDDGSKNANTIIIQDSDNATKNDIAALNLFLMGSNARIDGISPGNMKYVAGTSSEGREYTYHPYFKIPNDVKASPDGYVVLFHDDIVSDATMPIDDILRKYQYNTHTQNLNPLTRNPAIQNGTSPIFDSINVTSPRDIRKMSGGVNVNGYGFEVSDPGTYIVKLTPGMAYWVNNDYDDEHDLRCNGYVCDTVSIISVDPHFDLMGTTEHGFPIYRPYFRVTDGGISNEKPSPYRYNSWSAYHNVEISSSTSSKQISSARYVYLASEAHISFTKNVKCVTEWHTDPWPWTWRITHENWSGTTESIDLRLNSWTHPVTTKTDGKTYMTGMAGTYGSFIHDGDVVLPSGRDCLHGSVNSDLTLEHLPLENLSITQDRQTAYDRGFQVKAHSAHWSDAPPSFANNVVVNHTGSGRYVPDNNPTEVESPIYVYDNETPQSIVMTVDITHPNVGELSPLELVAPNGLTQNIYISGNWSEGDTKSQHIYSSLWNVTNGNWILRMADDRAGNTGNLNGWTLTVTYDTDSMYQIEQQTSQNPFLAPVHNNDAYMVIDKKLPWGTVGVESDHIRDTMGLSITNLPPDTFYSITNDDGFAVYGSTGNNGEITLPYEMGFENVNSLSLDLFPDAFVITDMTGMSVYDIRNDIVNYLPDSKFDGVVYGTTQYMKLPLTIDTVVNDITLNVDNCTAAAMPLPYLARNYTASEDKYVWVPVVPGLGTVCITVDGTELVMRLEDFNSGATAASAPSQSGTHSTAPDFWFTRNSPTWHNYAFPDVFDPIGGVGSDPIAPSVGVGTGTQYVATYSGTVAVTVSGTAIGNVDTRTIREYSDDSLSGTVQDVEDSEIRVGVSVYKNGERVRYVSLGTFTAVGHEIDTKFMSLPDGDGKSLWYVYTYRGNNRGSSINPDPVPTLDIPWYRCDSVKNGPGLGTTRYSITHSKCVYKHDPTSNSLCELNLSYSIRGSVDSSAVTFDVAAGDIIEYRIGATLDADHEGFSCGNDNTANYGNTNLSIDLKGVLFDHKHIQN